MTLNYKIGTEFDTALYDSLGLPVMVAAGIGWHRHMAVEWAEWEPIAPVNGVHTYVEPVPPPNQDWKHALLDESLAKAKANGIKIILCIRNSPGWANCSTISGCGRIADNHFMDFALFVDHIVTKYEHPDFDVQHFEIWNEPDIDITGDSTKGGWLQNPLAYIKMLKVVYEYVKLRHPNIVIMNGGFTLYPSSLWARDFIKMGGLAYIDILAFHSYDYIKTGKKLWENAAKIGTGLYPTQYHAILNALRSWIASSTYNPTQIKLTIPIWMNEGACIGYPGAEYPTNDELKRIQSYYAAFMAATMVSSNALFITPTRLNIELYSWWVSQGWDHSYGQTVKTGEWYYETNVLYDALKFALAQVNGCTHTSVTQSATSASIIKLAKSGGQALWLLWNTNTVNSSDISYTFASAPYKVWDVWGNDITGTLTNSGKTLAMTDTGVHTNVVWAQLTA